MAYDPEHRLVLAVIPGARTVENAEAITAEVKQRLGGQAPDLITSDEAPAYETAIEATFSEPVPPPSQRGPGRPRLVPQRRVGWLPPWSNPQSVRASRPRSWSSGTRRTGAATRGKRGGRTGSARTGAFTKR